MGRETALRSFGQLDACEAFEIALRSATGAQAAVIPYGAVVRDLVVPGARWSDLPARYGANWKSVHKRLTRLAHGGV